MNLILKYIFPVMFLLLGCGQNRSTEEEMLYKEVMAIHDDVMPKMRDINEAKKALRKLSDEENSTSEVDSLIKKLDDADEAMMSWMHDFKPKKSEDKEVNMTYLSEEKLKISDVREVMLEAIAAAESYISEKSKSQ